MNKFPTGKFVSLSPNDTFELGVKIGAGITGGEIIYLIGSLGSGKTLITKGIVNSLSFDIDDVVSPSFTLVNHYETVRANVFHIDLWRLENSGDAIFAVGLDEILENEQNVAIIEWADILGENGGIKPHLVVRIFGDGDDKRIIEISAENTK
ncbi:MAG: tRNA (adenosine(37)-N6)-threonylcarbamoyltransferase complex ATPase subunit type 1 TsaE [Pyrinomonadaceae bacterium]